MKINKNRKDVLKIDKLNMYQCISSDYCKGYNNAVDIANQLIEREKLLHLETEEFLYKEQEKSKYLMQLLLEHNISY